MKTLKELIYISAYVGGFADAMENDKLREASDVIFNFAKQVCSQGFINCNCQGVCTSDHK